MVTRLLLTILLLCHYCEFKAQGTSVAFQHLTPTQGLTDGKVWSIGQDKDGYIWIGTGYGLSRFNGYEVEHFMSEPGDSTTISNQLVNFQYATSRGNLYFGAYGIPSKLTSSSGVFTRFCFGERIWITTLCEGQPGQLWLGTSKGLMRYDEREDLLDASWNDQDSELDQYTDLTIQDMAFDGENLLYLATQEGLFAMHTITGHVIRYSQSAGDIRLPSDDVRNVVVDKSGRIWISTDYYGSRLCCLDPKAGTLRTFDGLHLQRTDWADNRIMDLLVDRDGRLWIASLRAGISLFDSVTEQITAFLHDPMQPWSIASNAVLTLHEDRDGTIWIGTEGYGVDYFRPDRTTFSVIAMSAFQTPTLADNWCRAVALDSSGRYWIGTYKGLSRWDPSSNTYRNYLLARKEFAEANNSVRSLVIDASQHVWIGTGGGLNILDMRDDHVVAIEETDSLNSNFISFVLQASDGKTYLSTPRGVFMYDRHTGKFSNFFKTIGLDTLTRLQVVTIYEDHEGRLWFGMAQQELYSYLPSSREVIKYHLQDLNPRSHAYDYVTSMTQDKEHVYWITTFSGVIAFDSRRDSIRVYTTADGFGSNKSSAVYVDSLDRVWVASNNGLCVLDSSRAHVDCFDVRDGLPTNYFYEGHAYPLENGFVAFPSYAGLVMLRPEKIEASRTKIPVLLTDLVVGGDPVDIENFVDSDQRINLRYYQNSFSLKLTGLNFARPGDVTYAYTLEGFDPGWHVTRERHVNYTNVPGGDYVFRYYTVTNGSSDEAAQHQLHIHVDTVYYATWWFRILSFVVMLLLVIGFFRWRLHQQRQMHSLANRAQELEKDKALVLYESLKQQLNPHFLFNSLTSLRGMIRVDQKLAGEFLDRMSSIYRYILRNRQHELVLLKEEIAFAQTYVELQKTRFSDGLVVEVNVPEEHADRRIAPVTLQNLIENAIKHNRIDPESPLRIQIFVEEDHLIVKNNLQRKEFVETSNKQGLLHLVSLYGFFDSRRVEIIENPDVFEVRIPLL